MFKLIYILYTPGPKTPKSCSFNFSHLCIKWAQNGQQNIAQSIVLRQSGPNKLICKASYVFRYHDQLVRSRNYMLKIIDLNEMVVLAMHFVPNYQHSQFFLNYLFFVFLTLQMMQSNLNSVEVEWKRFDPNPFGRSQTYSMFYHETKSYQEVHTCIGSLLRCKIWKTCSLYNEGWVGFLLGKLEVRSWCLFSPCPNVFRYCRLTYNWVSRQYSCI